MSLVRRFRTEKGWTQAELARRTGISRSGVAAIENGTLAPSVNAALALARALDRTVEELFGDAEERSVSWAWDPPRAAPAYWEAAFDRKVLAFPVEPLPYSVLPPDGWTDGTTRKPLSADASGMTLIVASCDPAAGFLAALMGSKTGVRMLPFHRSSNEALALLKQGVVHVAGIHLREVDEPGGNAAVVQELLGGGFRLLRGAVWHDGVAVRPGEGLSDLKQTVSPRVRWIGRRQGSGARRCQDKVLADGRADANVAQNHWEAAVAVRRGWADAGVCHRLAAEQAGLDFLMVSHEAFDLCYPDRLEGDPRITALRRVVQSADYRKSLAAFSGIDARTTGQEETV